MKKNYSFGVILFAPFALAQVPAGYYDTANGKVGATLKTELSKIITKGHQDKGYGELWTAYKTTDLDTVFENDRTILDIYSENPKGSDPYNYLPGQRQCGNYNEENNCYNREHIVPQSFFNRQAPMRNDAHFIRPTDGYVNQVRSNYPFGVVGSTTYISRNGSKLGKSVTPGYSDQVFEPIDEFKGDVARMILYFVTRYESQLPSFSSNTMLEKVTYPGLKKWQLDQLLIWATNDPVSREEIERNDAIYRYQGNRNPYIDRPEFIDQVFGNVVVDTQNPTVPTQLITSAVTSSGLDLSWNPATDDTGISRYEIFVNGVLKGTSSTTSFNITGLQPKTFYTLYVVAIDTAGNRSDASEKVDVTTLEGNATSPTSGACGTETFDDLPVDPNKYETHTWTTKNITWTATDSRTDQTLDGKALTLRKGSLSTNTSGGIGSLTATTQLVFAGRGGNQMQVLVNGKPVGELPFSSSPKTTTISNINIEGDIHIEIRNAQTGDRVILDNLSWTCYSPMGTKEVIKQTFSIKPNPVKNQEILVTGLETYTDILLYDMTGKVVQRIPNVRDEQMIQLAQHPKGIYIVKAGDKAFRLIIE